MRCWNPISFMNFNQVLRNKEICNFVTHFEGVDKY